MRRWHWIRKDARAAEDFKSLGTTENREAMGTRDKWETKRTRGNWEAQRKSGNWEANRTRDHLEAKKTRENQPEAKGTRDGRHWEAMGSNVAHPIRDPAIHLLVSEKTYLGPLQTSCLGVGRVDILTATAAKNAPRKSATFERTCLVSFFEGCLRRNERT